MMFARPLVQKDAALERLTRRRRLLFAGKRPKPEKIELLYFPHYVFKISLSVKGGQREMFLASDGVLGNFAFLEMDNLDFLESVDAPCFDFQVEVEKAKERAVDQCKWLLVKNGFHTNSPPMMQAVTNVKRLYYPYWVAYYRRRRGYDFKALDGISLAPIGLRMRRAFLAAFSHGNQ